MCSKSNYEKMTFRSRRFRLTHNVSPSSLPILRSSITVAWLESPQYLLTTDNVSRMHAFLEKDYYSVIFYSNMRKCVKYLKRTRSREYVIAVVVSYPTDVIHEMIDRLRRYRIVQTIYIVTTEHNIINWFSSSRNDITIFDNKNSMLDRLECLLDDIHKVKFEGGLFTTFNQKERALREIQSELGKFLWNDLLRS